MREGACKGGKSYLLSTYNEPGTKGGTLCGNEREITHVHAHAQYLVPSLAADMYWLVRTWVAIIIATYIVSLNCHQRLRGKGAAIL